MTTPSPDQGEEGSGSSRDHAPADQRQAETDGWRPIETAPRDGTVVLLYCPHGDGNPGSTYRLTAGNWFDVLGGTTEYRDADGRYLGQDDRDDVSGWLSLDGGFSEDTMMPTHWMPLPSPPGVWRATEDCRTCDGEGWVCENHQDRPWGEMSSRGDACRCGAGAPCGSCNLKMASAGYVDAALSSANPLFKEAATALRAAERREESLRASLAAIIAQWDSPNWKLAEPTAAIIGRARAVLNAPTDGAK